MRMMKQEAGSYITSCEGSCFMRAPGGGAGLTWQLTKLYSTGTGQRHEHGRIIQLECMRRLRFTQGAGAGTGAGVGAAAGVPTGAGEGVGAGVGAPGAGVGPGMGRLPAGAGAGAAVGFLTHEAV